MGVELNDMPTYRVFLHTYGFVCVATGVIGSEMPRITVASDALEGGIKYRLMLDVTTPGSEVGHAQLDFWVVDRPYEGTCVAASAEGERHGTSELDCKRQGIDACPYQ